MNKFLLSFLCAAACAGSTFVFAQNSMTEDKADQMEMDSNEMVNDEGYGNDEEYYGAEEGDAISENVQENFTNSEQNNTPMNPNMTGPQAP